MTTHTLETRYAEVKAIYPQLVECDLVETELQEATEAAMPQEQAAREADRRATLLAQQAFRAMSEAHLNRRIGGIEEIVARQARGRSQQPELGRQVFRPSLSGITAAYRQGLVEVNPS